MISLAFLFIINVYYEIKAIDKDMFSNFAGSLVDLTTADVKILAGTDCLIQPPLEMYLM